MSFDPARFLEVAEILGRDTTDEANLRTAVGRAYWASFLEVRVRLGVRTRTGRVHREVIGLLKKRDLTAGNQLDKLEELRTLADYELDRSDSWRSNWEMARSYANHILERLRRPR